MSTSGSYDYSLTAQGIINRACSKIGVYDPGETLSADVVSDALINLNLVVKQMLAEGIGLWLRKNGILYLVSGTQQYSLGPTGDRWATTNVKTTLTAAAALSATALTVTSTSGMTAADNIGIKLDDASVQWTTIASVDSSTGLTISDALTDSAASGNNVYTYTSKGQRPQKLIDCYRRSSDDVDTPCLIIAKRDYDAQSLKGATGPVTMVSYEPDLDNGTLYVWPSNDTTYDRLAIAVEGPVMDFDNLSDNPQFPIEWANTLVWCLADEMAPEFGINLGERQLITAKAQMLKETLLSYDDEEQGSVSFGMEFNR